MALRGTSGSKIGRNGMTRSERSSAMREASHKASETTIAGRTVQEVARKISTETFRAKHSREGGSVSGDKRR